MGRQMNKQLEYKHPYCVSSWERHSWGGTVDPCSSGWLSSNRERTAEGRCVP